MRTVTDLAPGERYTDSDGVFTVISHEPDGCSVIEREDGKRWVLLNPQNTQAN